MATILCVEDEGHIREEIAESMESTGHKVLQACDGKVALEMILEYRPDLVVSDITMPHMDGHDLVKTLREKHSQFDDTPFIFLSALADSTDVLDGMRIGADDYLTKPIDFDLLLGKIETSLRQVERMRARKEQQFVKLYKALSGEAGAEQATTPAEEAEQGSVELAAGVASEEKKGRTTHQKKVKRSKMARAKKPEEDLGAPSPDTYCTSLEEPQKQPVYGTVFKFPNLHSLADELGSKYHGVCARIRERATRILKQMLLENDVVSETSQEDIFVSYSNADKDQAQEKSKQLSQALQDDLLEDQYDKLSKTYSISREKIEYALIARGSLFQVSISQEDLSDTAQFERAVLNVIEETRENEYAPTLLVTSIKNAHGSLKPFTLIACNGDTQPIRFFNYDESSKLKMRASFALFGRRNFVKAGFLIDALTLQLLEGETKQLPAEDIVVVDVHFETLISEDFASLYTQKFLKYTKNSRHATMINVRSIPRDITSASLEEILRPLGKAASRRSVQINPESIEAYSISRLPISCIVCSYSEMMQSKTALGVCLKVKPVLEKNGTLLILRGLDAMDEIPQLNLFGFDGYAVNKTQSD